MDAPRIAAALRTSGITVLRDSAVERAASGRVVWIAGMNDLWTGHQSIARALEPVLGPIASSSRFGSRYAAGHVVENGRHLLVGTGIGTSVLPVRFRVPPEILIATLHSR